MILYPNQNSILGVLFCRLEVHNIPAAFNPHIVLSFEQDAGGGVWKRNGNTTVVKSARVLHILKNLFWDIFQRN